MRLSGRLTGEIAAIREPCRGERVTFTEAIPAVTQAALRRAISSRASASNAVLPSGSDECKSSSTVLEAYEASCEQVLADLKTVAKTNSSVRFPENLSMIIDMRSSAKTANRVKHVRLFGLVGTAKETGIYEMPTPSGTALSEGRIRDWDRFLSEAYGSTPRRIAEETSLRETLMAPLMVGNIVRAPEPEYPVNSRVRGQVWNHRPEADDTLRVGAARLSELTWISQPPRAVLECFNSPFRRDTILRVMKFLARLNVDSSEMVSLSEKIGMSDGARRLCSLADTLNEIDGYETPAWMKELSRTYLADTSHRIRLYETDRSQASAFHDSKWNVEWNISPLEIVNRARS